MKKVLFFLDYTNVNRAACDNGYRLNYEELRLHIGEGRFLMNAHCYDPIAPRAPSRMGRTIEELWNAGYVVHSKVGSLAGERYKCDFDAVNGVWLFRLVSIEGVVHTTRNDGWPQWKAALPINPLRLFAINLVSLPSILGLFIIARAHGLQAEQL